MLSQSCDTLAGVGPALLLKLAKCGIYSIQDLLLHLPFRYQDRTRITPIQDLRPNDWGVILGEIVQVDLKRGKRPVLDCLIEDKTGFLTLRFFHFNSHQAAQWRIGTSIRAFGEIRSFLNRLEMIHPEYQLITATDQVSVEETLTPIYPTTIGLTQHRLRRLIKTALLTHKEALKDLEWMSHSQLETYGLKPIALAIEELHNPPPDIILKNVEEGTHPSLKRLVFDELLAQRLSMQLARQQRATFTAPPFSKPNTFISPFLATLPFQLTAAQQRVFIEIQRDLMQSTPMLRLVQGDVGSGKTVIAALSALQAIGNGFQVALMAPTDLLSAQHAETLTPWFASLGLSVQRLSGKMNAKQRRESLQALSAHHCHLMIGTHALFQESVSFAKLGLVIIDEQHRFGVEQRMLLQQKGQQDQVVPHQLLMTATPIPRTLAMTHYAHLELSIIDERPPGRSEVITAILNQEKRESIITRLQAALLQGRQAYWICTLIDDSEKLQCMAAVATSTYLQAHLPTARVGLVHGRMKIAEKEAIMSAFKQGELDLLVATTVIEVGVDVPNASLMIIENSERLGLSQLHQLRGRVGRGSIQSHCILLYQSPLSFLGKARLQLIRATSDGFVIAEKDLALRGAGEILGTRQTGYRQYKIAHLQRDHAFLEPIAHLAKQLVQENVLLAQALATRWLGDFEQFLQS